MICVNLKNVLNSILLLNVFLLPSTRLESIGKGCKVLGKLERRCILPSRKPYLKKETLHKYTSVHVFYITKKVLILSRIYTRDNWVCMGGIALV